MTVLVWHARLSFTLFTLFVLMRLLCNYRNDLESSCHAYQPQKKPHAQTKENVNNQNSLEAHSPRPLTATADCLNSCNVTNWTQVHGIQSVNIHLCNTTLCNETVTIPNVYGRGTRCLLGGHGIENSSTTTALGCNITAVKERDTVLHWLLQVEPGSRCSVLCYNMSDILSSNTPITSTFDITKYNSIGSPRRVLKFNTKFEMCYMEGEKFTYEPGSTPGTGGGGGVCEVDHLHSNKWLLRGGAHHMKVNCDISCIGINEDAKYVDGTVEYVISDTGNTTIGNWADFHICLLKGAYMGTMTSSADGMQKSAYCIVYLSKYPELDPNNPVYKWKVQSILTPNFYCAIECTCNSERTANCIKFSEQ